jgi:hypothetical protein
LALVFLDEFIVRFSVARVLGPGALLIVVEATLAVLRESKSAGEQSRDGLSMVLDRVGPI